MSRELKLYNSLTNKKEVFSPLTPPYVGMYVCGPTVYSDVHLGNIRTFMSFDVIRRYLMHLGYNVRYVRNITDVGHLESDADEGEDKIAKKAKLENLEPMQIVQRYTNGFHSVLSMFNILPPDIEPSATGHIVEQIEMVQKLLENGFAYESNGSVYFDVLKYSESHQYGILSGKILEDLMASERALDGQAEKKNKVDFAIWKKASPEHIMRWDSPWGKGFPGWHLECSVMSTKYLGEQFDIHGGGMDLQFPHHECEIAQSVGAYGEEPAKYWLHTNMLTVNGQKMSKSLGNSFLPEELVTGNHELLDRPYSPMTVRFFMLQSHYSSTLDFSNEALTAAHKGYKKLVNSLRIVKGMEYQKGAKINEDLSAQIEATCDACTYSMNDDFNTAKTIAQLFNLSKRINAINNGNVSVSELDSKTFGRMKDTYIVFMENILGLQEERLDRPEQLLETLISVYKEAKFKKEYDQVDAIRAGLKSTGIILKDMKDRVDWSYEE